MISIVIPTFNEVRNIIPLIKNLIVLISDFEYEIIVVDDDSPDGTSDEVNKYGEFISLEAEPVIGDILKFGINETNFFIPVIQ